MQKFFYLLLLGCLLNTGCHHKQISPTCATTEKALEANEQWPSAIQIIQQAGRLRIIVFSDACFETGTAHLSLFCCQQLHSLLPLLQHYAADPVRILGYADDVLDARIAQELSLAQARAVAFYLQVNGIPLNRLKVHGQGQQNFIASNTNVRASRANWRVELIIENGFCAP